MKLGRVTGVDSVDAGMGEVILYATVVAIVDNFDIEGRSTRLA